MERVQTPRRVLAALGDHVNDPLGHIRADQPDLGCPLFATQIEALPRGLLVPARRRATSRAPGAASVCAVDSALAARPPPTTPRGCPSPTRASAVGRPPGRSRDQPPTDPASAPLGLAGPHVSHHGLGVLVELDLLNDRLVLDSQQPLPYTCTQRCFSPSVADCGIAGNVDMARRFTYNPVISTSDPCEEPVWRRAGHGAARQAANVSPSATGRNVGYARCWSMSRSSARGPGLSAGRAARHRRSRVVRRGQGAEPSSAVDGGRAAHDLPPRVSRSWAV